MADNKIPSLDGLRAVSILLVVINHVAYIFPKPLFKYFNFEYYGHVGVTMFFVISGFLISTLLLNEKAVKDGKVDVKKFYIRRFFRILPVSFLYILCILSFSKAAGQKVESGAFIHAFTYTVNFMIYPAAPWLLGHLWSLGVEEQFYIFWPWVTKNSLKTITIVAFVIIAYAPCARAITYTHQEFRLITLSPFFNYADSIMIGCLLAISRRTLPGLWRSPLLGSRALLLLSMFIIWFVPFLRSVNSPQWHTSYFTVPFGTAAIALCTAYIIANTITFKNGAVFKFLNTALMSYIGVLSYSIYIWQQFFLGSEVHFGMPYSWWRAFPLNVLLTFCASFLSYNLWEKGFLKLKEKFRVV